MKSIRSLITTAIVSLLVITVTTIGYFNIANSSNYYEERSKMHLEALVAENGLKIEKSFISVEHRIDAAKLYYENTINESLLFSEDNSSYLNRVLGDSEALVKSITVEIDNNTATFCIFSHFVAADVFQMSFFHDENGSFTDLEVYPQYEDFSVYEDYMLWYHKPIEARKGIWSGPYYDIFQDRTIMTYSAPVIVNDVIVAIVGTDIDFKTFQSFVTDIEVYDSHSAYLLDDQYNYVVQPSNDIINVSPASFDDLKLNSDHFLKKYDSGVIDFDANNQMFAYYTLYNEWTLVVSPPLKNVYQSLYVLIERMVWFSLLILIFVLIISKGISNIVSKPINILEKYVKTLTEKKSSIQLPERIKDNKSEIGYLGNAIFTMHQQLLNLFEQLERSNEELDLKVKLKTSELSDSNEELRATIETLEDYQKRLARAEKHESLRQLIQNLAHRLNTPFGNIALATSFLIDTMNTAKQEGRDCNLIIEQCLEGLSIIHNAQTQITEILNNLNYLIPQDDVDHKSEVKIKEFIEYSIETFFSNHLDRYINIDFTCDPHAKTRINVQLFKSMINFLILHAYNARNKHAENNDTIRIMVEVIDDCLVLKYVDPLLGRLHDNKDIFDPFSTAQFNETNTNLELFIVYDIVTQGLHGNIQFNQIEIIIEV